MQCVCVCIANCDRCTGLVHMNNSGRCLLKLWPVSFLEENCPSLSSARVHTKPPTTNVHTVHSTQIIAMNNAVFVLKSSGISGDNKMASRAKMYIYIYIR